MGDYDKSAEMGQKMILKFLKDRMESLGMNQNQLSIESGISRGTLSKYFSHSQEMGLKNYLKICGALKLRPYLIPSELDKNEIQRMFFN